jgi:hypothetical protein
MEGAQIPTGGISMAWTHFGNMKKRAMTSTGFLSKNLDIGMQKMRK